MVFEFVVSTVIFFGLVVYTMSYIGYSSGVLRVENYGSGLEAVSAQVSETIVKTSGLWDGNVPVIPGLAEEWPVLNSTKIYYLENYCDSNGLGMLLDIGDNLMLKIKDSSDIVLADCGSAPPDTYSKTTRYALNESGSRLVVEVYAW